ncbi:hypothetical protein JXO59_10610 [candidate division KSB1 bacterium]|nr:hypothetical protein [candidate division KSB1 bacterium]
MYKTLLVTIFLLALLVFSAAAQMQVKNSADDVVMHITQTGNVGVGLANTNPTQTLSVAGTMGIKEGGTSPTL